MVRRFLVALLVSAVLAAVLYLLFLGVADRQAILGAVQRLTLAGWAAILGLSLLNYLLRFLRWQLYIRRLAGLLVPTRQHLAIYLAGFALTTTPGKVGEAVRSLYLKRHGVRYSHSLSALFVERLVDVLTIAILTTVAALSMPEVRSYAIGTLLVVAAVVVAIRKGFVERLVQGMGNRMPLLRLRTLAGQLADMLRGSSRLLKTRFLYGGLGLGLLSWGAEGLGLYLILQYMGVDVPLPLAISAYAVAVLAGALSFIPGGLGAAEVVMYWLLLEMGVPVPEAAAATLVCRIATLWFAVLLGLLPFAVLSFRQVIPDTLPPGED